MKKVTNYQILEKKDAKELAKEVMNAIAQGWQPIGGISARASGSGIISIYAQAMVQYEQ